MARDPAAESCVAATAITEAQHFDVGFGAAVHRGVSTMNIPVAFMQVVWKQCAIAQHELARGIVLVPVKHVHVGSS